MFFHTEVHHSGFVVEYAHTGSLVHYPHTILFAVAFFHSNQHKQSLADFRYSIAVNPDGSPANSLYYQTQIDIFGKGTTIFCGFAILTSNGWFSKLFITSLGSYTIIMKILITGVSSGFGRAVAQALAEQGHEVYGTVRKEVEPIKIQ